MTYLEENNKISFKERISICIACIEALQDLECTHNDVKPSNFLIKFHSANNKTWNGKDLVLIDFGIRDFGNRLVK